MPTMIAIDTSSSMIVKPRSLRSDVRRRHRDFLVLTLTSRASSRTRSSTGPVAVVDAVADAEHQHLQDQRVVRIGRQRLDRPAPDIRRRTRRQGPCRRPATRRSGPDSRRSRRRWPTARCRATATARCRRRLRRDRRRVLRRVVVDRQADLVEAPRQAAQLLHLFFRQRRGERRALRREVARASRARTCCALAHDGRREQARSRPAFRPARSRASLLLELDFAKAVHRDGCGHAVALERDRDAGDGNHARSRRRRLS